MQFGDLETGKYFLCHELACGRDIFSYKQAFDGTPLEWFLTDIEFEFDKRKDSNIKFEFDQS